MLRLTPNMTVDEEEERNYLDDVVHQDIVATDYGWCYPGIVDDAHLNFGQTRNIPLDFVPTTTSVWSNLDRNVFPSTDGILNEGGLISLYRSNTAMRKNPNSNVILPNPNNRNSNSKQHAQEPAKRRTLNRPKMMLKGFFLEGYQLALQRECYVSIL